MDGRLVPDGVSWNEMKSGKKSGQTRFGEAPLPEQYRPRHALAVPTVLALLVTAFVVSFFIPRLTAAQQAQPVPPAPPQASAPVEFKTGIADPSNTVLALYMARSAGLDTAQGLGIDILDMNGGSRGAEELQAGRIDVMSVGLSSVMKVNQSGGDLRLIASLSNVMRFTFFSARGVTGAADLKGGTIGISTAGSESDSAATLALQKLGLTRSDVAIKEYGSSAHRLAALQSGEIKAALLDEPAASAARQGGLNALVDLEPMQIPWLFAGIAVRHADLGARRDLLTRFLKAGIEGNYIAINDEKRAKQVLAKDLKIASSKNLDIAYRDFVAQSPPNLEPSLPGVQNTLKVFPKASQNVGDYVDMSLLDALKDQGFSAAMEVKYKR
jgi:ABC-type nitrate/sulfonate/bicarbonate transport system substrate-binding protein